MAGPSATDEALEYQRSLSLLEATIESTADGILVVDSAGKITRFNNQFAGMWRIPAPILASGSDDQAIEFVLAQLVDPGGFVAKVRELYATPEAESFDELRFKDGRVFERYSKPQRLGGRPVGRVWSFRDVTARRQAEHALRNSEDQLRQSQKMEAVGRLAGGVAHDFNNMLSVVLSGADLILAEMTSDDPLRSDLEQIRKAGERAADLTRQLLTFSRQPMLLPRVVDLNQIVAGMDKMLGRLLGADVEMTMLPGVRLGKVKVDPGHIEQIVMNLVVNARDAMTGGGKLTIQTNNTELDDQYASQHLGVIPGPYVVLAVTDTGVGMDRETQAHVFEPFFTTKETGRGTGLGLSIVFGIVKQSGGHVWIDSELGRGTTFHVYFPRTDEIAQTRSSAPPTSERRRGSETILLVEDDEQVRAVARGILRRSGYTVLEAPGPGEALLVVEQYGPKINLLVTDVVLPRMNGPQLVERVRTSRPDIKVLFMSGYTDEAIIQYGILDSGVAFLQKPITPDALTRKVREALGP